MSRVQSPKLRAIKQLRAREGIIQDSMKKSEIVLEIRSNRFNFLGTN
jgi:hypothetical protein